MAYSCTKEHSSTSASEVSRLGGGGSEGGKLKDERGACKVN